MLKSITGLLFIISICTPYVQLLLMGRNSSTALDFLAFGCLVITSIILIWRARDSSTALVLYSLVAAGAVFLYLATFDTILSASEYLNFKSEQEQLDKFVVELHSSHRRPEGIQTFSPAHPLSSFISCQVLPDSTVLLTRGGEASRSFWGVAYSESGRRPTYEYAPMYYWRQLDNHWYAWLQYDN